VDTGQTTTTHPLPDLSVFRLLKDAVDSDRETQLLLSSNCDVSNLQENKNKE
jgi:hypothetical protein